MVCEDDTLDGLSAHGTGLVSLLQLLGAGVAGHQVARSPVNDAAVLRPGLADHTGLQTRVWQTRFHGNTSLWVRGVSRVTGRGRGQRRGGGAHEFRGGGGGRGGRGGELGGGSGGGKGVTSLSIRNILALILLSS